ncbi:MAG: energy transducer TonB [Bacteroidota bacterium]|nr:energy transducer TonB [Bacteroidota bacterium]
MNPGKQPEFRGGDSLLQVYVMKNLLLPDKKLHKKASGLVIKVRFDIDTSGKIWNVQFINPKQIDPAIEEAVLTLICKMPDWIPGVAHYNNDTALYKAVVVMNADVHFWVRENGNEKPAYIDVFKSSPIKLRKPVAGEAEIFSFVEVMPSFTDGGMKAFVMENLKYPDAYKDSNLTVTVYVSFIIEKDGRISDAFVRKSIPSIPLFEAEAVRVVSIMPNWIPGTMNGHPVRVQMTQPVIFKPTP